MSDKIWLNTIQLSRHGFGVDSNMFFREIIEFIQRNEPAWKKWFDENEPEAVAVPDYEERITMDRTLGAFVKMVLVRSIREDRTSVACQQFINQQLDPKFTAPVTDAISDIYDE